MQIFEVEKVMLMVPESQSQGQGQGQGNSSPLPSSSRSVTPLPPDTATATTSSTTIGRDGSIDSLAANDGTPTTTTTTSTTSSSNGRVLYSFVRKRSCGGFAAFGLTTVKQLESGQRVELKQVNTQ